MKTLVKAGIKRSIKWMPWGANEALFEGLLEHLGPAETLARCFPRMHALGSLHLCADGDYGVMRSALNDGLLLPTYARDGSYEPRMARLFGDFFVSTGGGTYLDIGANIGLTTIPVARDPNVKCLAFEPEPTNFTFLEANVRQNCHNCNVDVFQTALYKERARLSFSLNSTNIGDHKIAKVSGVDESQIEVEAMPLDDFSANIDGTIAVKIDTQGAEPFVIAGGARVLAQASLVVLEFSPYHMDLLGSDPEVIFHFLSGFRRIGIASLSGNDVPSPQPAADAISSLRERLAAWHKGDQTYWDIFACRTDWQFGG